MTFNLDKKEKYVVACSFGPDSMALLDMLIKQNYDVIVAHVNYHKRDISNYEEEQLRKYCKHKKVSIEVLDTTGLKCDKNFQEWARELRYKFFKKVLDKHRAKAVLVAHQEDDLIETFLMQEKRGGIVNYWGLAEKTHIFDVDVIRPLLAFSKADLEKYDSDYNVPFSIDSSNLTNVYERNKIRHEIVEKMSRNEKDQIIKKINTLNKRTFKPTNFWSITEFLALSNEEIVRSISNYLSKTKEHVDLSSNYIDEIRKAVAAKKTFVEIKLTKKISLLKDYDVVCFNSQIIDPKYCYKIEKDTIVNDDYFYIDFTNSKAERNIQNDSYPLFIKAVNKNDKLKINDYECEIRRLFIDWKVPHRYRNIWPGIYDKNNKLIYVPRYRKSFIDKHASKFVIKFTNKF